MAFKPNYALYYPNIEFQNFQWLYSAALIWDKIYRIVPSSYTPHDPKNVKDLFEDGEIGIFLDPSNYAKEVADEFLSKLENEDWDAAALTRIDEDYARIHKEKVDVTLRDMIISTGGIDSGENWYFVPTNFEAQYMTYLANSMAEKNNLSIISDKPAAWACSTYYSYNGQVNDFPQIDDSTQLASLLFKEIIPVNLTDISIEELLKFRKSKKDERQNFMRAINNAANQISNCSDPKIINDLVHDLMLDVEQALKDYRKCLGDFKYNSLTGLYSIAIPVATEVINQTAHIRSQELQILSALGVAIGVVTSIREYRKSKVSLAKESDYSYLLQMRNRWEKVYQGGSYSYFLSRQIEEFIND
ncbi:MAG: hypothetical protein VR72_16060 [Clostridiaceae bacterium BRH_c20a]|nr:MAG: hypothetical protein VR72_16060 [Clostridiaceae bacterium BRH_c20a]